MHSQTYSQLISTLSQSNCHKLSCFLHAPKIRLGGGGTHMLDTQGCAAKRGQVLARNPIPNLKNFENFVYFCSKITRNVTFFQKNP